MVYKVYMNYKWISGLDLVSYPWYVILYIQRFQSLKESNTQDTFQPVYSYRFLER
jgi:hypothetical protein